MVARADPAEAHLPNRIQMEQKLRRMSEALRELYDLLEQYAPSWYTRDLHERARSALQEIKLKKRTAKTV
jgi:hypothetical protein